MGGFAGRALVELVLTGVVCGVLGVQVVLRRLAFFTKSLGHVTFLGIVAASITQVDVKIGAGVAAMAAVALIGRGGVASRRRCSGLATRSVSTAGFPKRSRCTAGCSTSRRRVRPGRR